MSYPLSRDQHLELYYYMKLNRALDDQLVRLFRQNVVVGGLYSNLGQEATSVGTAYALEKRDWLAPMIRNVGGLLVKGYKPRDILMQYMARYDSPTHGKDGTSHFGDIKVRHVVSPISMLGDLVPVMAGVAIGGRYLGQNIVAMTWVGDGATSTGAFHEGLNFAATQQAPLVLVVENNQWAYSTPVAKQVPIHDLADRAKAYGIASSIVDGNDVVAVYQTTKEAVERCRAGKGPVLIEAKTMRMKGHAQHDPAEYVPKEMFAYWEARDPIARYEKYLTENKIWDEKTKAALDARIEKELKEDLEFAEKSPLPPPELAEQGVYCDGCHTVEAEWKRSKKEVTPPQSNVKPEWQVSDFGGFDLPSAMIKQAAAAARNGGKAASFTAHGTKPMHAKSDGKIAARKSNGRPDKSAEKMKVAERVPFGRGPKGKAGRK
ncbi:MAG TPA: thiamine pyrophosphate-dependent dehydrogenase E1 component subunit alpha [Candidatus Acidoferrales bacterium]|nr:thiamine pyrophosphate-dependent dehydrogenase E1 component subunit alpha [Candidatus Acidoferrales bacterium]